MEIDSDSPQGVKDLRSRFEQLSRLSPGKSSTPTTTTTTTPTQTPRQRVSSNSLNVPADDAQVAGSSAAHLRTSSSASDLRSSPTPSSTKRAPPPPPPPRGSKFLSPSPTASAPSSPLLRPAPVPPMSSAQQPLEGMPPSVSALKSRFILPNSPITHSPRPSVSIAETRSAFLPRPPSSVGLHQQMSSPDGSFSSHSSSRTTSQDDEYDDADPPVSGLPSIVPPPIPARKQQNGQTDPTVKSFVTTPSDSSLEGDTGKKATAATSRPVPPPRHRATLAPEAAQVSTSLPVPTTTPPPPLPARRTTVYSEMPLSVSTPNLHPGRPPPPRAGTGTITVEVGERRSSALSKLPPPPTRMIGLNDKLPPARRPATPSSDEESGDEDEPLSSGTTKGFNSGGGLSGVDAMPDTSCASRRAPILTFRPGATSEPKIHVHPHTDCVALSGSVVVTSHGHHLKVYDLAQFDAVALSIDMHHLVAGREMKVTCMEFRPSSVDSEQGCILWIGTKDGHIVEVDVRNGMMRGVKHAAHLYPITGIFRYARSMVTLDDSGKALVFSPDPDNDLDIDLVMTIPRVVRTTDKQDFVRMVGGKIWTAGRGDSQGGAGGTSKVPVIRVFDVFHPGSMGRSVLPSEHVGSVTSATIIPSQPDVVYVGHEEGYISIWELDAGDGYPRCMEVMRVSTSDVLCLEGVNDRLWAGGRGGMISVYDTVPRPWVVTNCWNAHAGVPVSRLMMNEWGVVKSGELCVASVGRDEQLRFWDGLLKVDWVENELVKLESTFCTFRPLDILVFSWNCDSARPEYLNGEEANFNLLHDALHSVSKPPDIMVFGFQEVIDLESRKMVAKNVLLGGGKKKGSGGGGDLDHSGISDKVTSAYKKWHDRLIVAVKAAMPRESYLVVHTENLVGLFTCIFVKAEERMRFGDVAVTTVKRGMGGRYGNKGAIVARMVIGDSSICFINCHLAAGQGAVRRRNADVAGILEEKSVFGHTVEHPLAYVDGGDGSMILDHEFVILSGDLNYRIDHRRDAIIAAVRAGDLNTLYPHDQLVREMKHNRYCRLRGFSEGPLSFPPTYKYDLRSDEYDTSEKHRSPAWCDRILWKARVGARVKQTSYRRYEANVSDHRPISGSFEVWIKGYDGEKRKEAKMEVESMWAGEKERRLESVEEFLEGQRLI